jgi:beta-phosphoglucomutase-like phosphatase (HAD superfamily)
LPVFNNVFSEETKVIPRSLDRSIPVSLDPLPSVAYTRRRASEEEYQEMFKRHGAWHWDIDGCTVKNEHVHVQAWIDAAAKYDVALTDALFDVKHDINVPQPNETVSPVKQYLRGSDPAVIASWILGQNDPQISKGIIDVPEMLSEVEKIKKMHLQGFLDNKDMLEAREGIPEILESFSENNWILGAVTGSKRPIFEANMSVLGGAGKLWDYVVTAEEVLRKKPHPYSYNLGLVKTAQLLGFEAPSHDALSYVRTRSGSCEDGKSGVIASVLADIPCVQYILPTQEVFTEEVEAHPLKDWVFPATSPAQLRANIKVVAGNFTPPPALCL